MKRLTFLLLSFLFCIAVPASSQTIDPYSRLTDPRAIAYLDGIDQEPLRYLNSVGWPQERDPIDNYFVIAKGEGPGILTHLWLQLYNIPDSVTDLKLYIDDTLVAHDRLFTFFNRRSGIFRTPLDSLQSGGLVCAIQMPFMRNFRITYYSRPEYCCLFWAVGWRPVLDAASIEAFSKTPSPTAEARLIKAEEVYWSGDSPWKGVPAESFTAESVILKTSAIERTIAGPGLITELHITPSTYDSNALRNLWIELYWDGCPTPSVNVPLADFFAVGAGMRNVRSHPIRVQNGKLTSYFPMPFAVSAKLRIVNRAENSVTLSVTGSYTREPVDIKHLGYFEAQFNEKKPTAFHIFHPVGYHQGRGKFIGMQLALPDGPDPAFLEGDPFFFIDSNYNNYINYTGSEDYFNGGWYFADGPFSLPFAGCTALYSSLYRLHYFDAIDFKSSFQLLLQHGAHNDFKTWYRTVGYFYTQWTPFWLDRDTILHGSTLAIEGTGYGANEQISIEIDGKFFAATLANDAGSFYTIQKVTDTIPTGARFISVNGVQRPEPIWVIDRPDIYWVRDSLPNYVNWRDSVTVAGAGFPPNKIVKVFLDTIEFEYSNKITTDATGGFHAKVVVPLTVDGLHDVIAKTDAANQAIAANKLRSTRTFFLEIEKMMPPVLAEGIAKDDYMGYFSKSWSEQHYLLFLGEPEKRVIVKFTLPLADTFDVSMLATKGLRFGDYRIQLDNITPVDFFAFEAREISDPIQSAPINFGVHYLDKGEHFLSFTCIGKDPQATEYLLGADLLILKPTTPFKAAIPSAPLDAGKTFTVYPNPTQTTLHLNIGSDSIGRSIEAAIIDALGVTRASYETLSVNEAGRVTVPVATLVPGVYHIRISQNGEPIGSAAFTKY